MITRFLFEGGLGRFSFDYLGPPWAFVAIVLLLIVILALLRSLLKLLK
jgi:hypothetical protein